MSLTIDLQGFSVYFLRSRRNDGLLGRGQQPDGRHDRRGRGCGRRSTEGVNYDRELLKRSRALFFFNMESLKQALKRAILPIAVCLKRQNPNN